MVSAFKIQRRALTAVQTIRALCYHGDLAFHTECEVKFRYRQKDENTTFLSMYWSLRQRVTVCHVSPPFCLLLSFTSMFGLHLLKAAL